MHRVVNDLGGVLEGLTGMMTPGNLAMTADQHTRSGEPGLDLIVDPRADPGQLRLIKSQSTDVPAGAKHIKTNMHPLQGDELTADPNQPDIPQPPHDTDGKPVLSTNDHPIDWLDHEVGLVVEELLLEVAGMKIAASVEGLDVATASHRQQVRRNTRQSIEWNCPPRQRPTGGPRQPVDADPTPPGHHSHAFGRDREGSAIGGGILMVAVTHDPHLVSITSD